MIYRDHIIQNNPCSQGITLEIPSVIISASSDNLHRTGLIGVANHSRIRHWLKLPRLCWSGFRSHGSVPSEAINQPSMIPLPIFLQIDFISYTDMFQSCSIVFSVERFESDLIQPSQYPQTFTDKFESYVKHKKLSHM